MHRTKDASAPSCFFVPTLSLSRPAHGIWYIVLGMAALFPASFPTAARAQSTKTTEPPKAAAPAPAAEELLKSADRSRGGVADGLTWTVRVESVEDGTPTDRTYSVRAKDLNALAVAQAPARVKGETLLFNDRTLWFFKPGLKKPVPISARQKLSGQAANGDIASTNYARDYEGTVVGEENVEGKPAWKLNLQARGKNVTYDKIRYWVDKEKLVGVKAEFLTLKGELFKTATFEYANELKTAGKAYPFVSKMVIVDAVTSGNKTSITYTTPSPEPQADSVFNVNNLAR
jgi:hypothetical protein